jgi:hypothetical protein
VGQRDFNRVASSRGFLSAVWHSDDRILQLLVIDSRDGVNWVSCCAALPTNQTPIDIYFGNRALAFVIGNCDASRSGMMTTATGLVSHGAVATSEPPRVGDRMAAGGRGPSRA